MYKEFHYSVLGRNSAEVTMGECGVNLKDYYRNRFNRPQKIAECLGGKSRTSAQRQGFVAEQLFVFAKMYMEKRRIWLFYSLVA